MAQCAYVAFWLLLDIFLFVLNLSGISHFLMFSDLSRFGLGWHWVE
jgi:hypothetical protein